MGTLLSRLSPINMNEEKIKYIQKNQSSPMIMAQALAADHPEIVRADNNLYRNNGKFFDLLSDSDLDELFCDFCAKYGADKAWKGVSSVIRAFLVLPSIKKVGKMNDYTDLICLNNGVLNIHTKDFVPHPAPYYFDSIVNVNYSPGATQCPTFIEYLNSTFNGDKETIANIIRLGGYLLDTSCASERMFLFDGNGANGKSVLINIFSMFFSEDQISPLSLDVLASNGFSKELLIKSRVNFAAEQKKSYLDSEEIKKIITGDRIEINRKFKVSLSFTPKTKIIVACNGLPKFNDTTHAIYRRMILVRFPNQYLSQSEYDRAKSKRTGIFIKDNSILEKIKLEKSSVLNMFIEGLIDLRKNNYEFVESKDSVIAMLEFKRDSDTVREFLEDNYESDEMGEMTIRDVYEHYKNWYRMSVQDSGSFKYRINELGRRICEVLGVKPSGKKYIFSNTTQRSERNTIYPIRIKEEPMEDLPVLTKEEAEKQLNFKI